MQWLCATALAARGIHQLPLEDRGTTSFLRLLEDRFGANLCGSSVSGCGRAESIFVAGVGSATGSKNKIVAALLALLRRDA